MKVHFFTSDLEWNSS